MQKPLGVTPFADARQRLPFLVSIPMEDLLLAVGNSGQIGAGIDLMSSRIHSTSKLSFKHYALVGDPLRQVVINLSDEPIVVPDISRHAGHQSEYGTGGAGGEGDQGVHAFEYRSAAGLPSCRVLT